MSQNDLRFDQLINAPPSQVYNAFTNATALKEWLCDVATVKPQPGGRIYLAWNDGYYSSGEYTGLEEDRNVEFIWFGRGEPGGTRVNVSITETDSGSSITLQHTGFNAGPGWEKTREECNKGWKKGLENLVSVLETGEDLRFVLRPMLGIILNDFNEDIARQINVPVSKGIRIDDTVEGMGARDAGLRSDDVIVEMDGKPTEDFASLNMALNGTRAGDTIEVVFYRAAEKMNTMMELSRRPIPDIPDSTAELAKQVEQRYKDRQVKIESFFEGVTDEEASFKISPPDWSAKEVMAHLIQGERYYQFYISEVVGGQESWADDYGGNVQASIDATLTAYPTIRELIEAFRLSLIETAALLAKLPPEFAQQKASYWRIAYGVLQDPYHDNAHLLQMQESIDAARAG